MVKRIKTITEFVIEEDHSGREHTIHRVYCKGCQLWTREMHIGCCGKDKFEFKNSNHECDETDLIDTYRSLLRSQPIFEVTN